MHILIQNLTDTEMKRLQDNVTIITGGGKGIGFGLAQAFAEEGSDLVLTGSPLTRMR